MFSLSSSHRYLLYRQPCDMRKSFDRYCLIYQTGCSTEVAAPILKDFKGHLQTDGYTAYVLRIGESKNITHLDCWAHARQGFDDMLTNKADSSITPVVLLI